MMPMFAQVGLFVMSAVAMYLMFGVPFCLIIAAIFAILRGSLGKAEKRPGIGWSNSVFLKTFGGLAIVIGSLTLGACIWAAMTIGK